MMCYSCHKEGYPVKEIKSDSGKVYTYWKCFNPDCVFDYVSFEGQTKQARPSWIVPKESKK